MKIERSPVPYSRDRAKETQQRVLDYLQERQDIYKLLDPYKPETIAIFNGNDFPIKTVHVGDTHLTHVASNVNALSNAVNNIGKKGIFVGHGNIIDSVSNKFLKDNIIKVGLDLNQQVDLARQILSPLDKKGQIILIGKNGCHEGWSEKTSSYDVTRNLVSPGSPLLYNGGQIILKDEKNEVGRIEGYHNSGKGLTRWSPEGSVRERGREVPFGRVERPDVIIDGHMHQLTCSQDVSRSPIDRKDHITTLGEVGASKGSKDLSDSFTNAFGVAPRNQPGDCGEGLVVVWRKNYASGRIKPYPVADYGRAKELFDAEELYESAQRIGVYGELYGEMMASGKFDSSRKELIVEDCLERKNDTAVKSEGEAPLYKTVSYEIDSKLPIRIHFIGNTRVGSSSLERTQLKSDLRDIEKDPFAYYVATRRLLNQFVHKSSKREEVLNDLSHLLGMASTSALGIMLTDEMRHSGWESEITKKILDQETGKTVKKKFAPILPGDYLYYQSEMKSVPIILPETTMFLNLNSGKEKTPYTFYLRDKLSHFTSLIHPYHGLERIRQIWGIDADVMVGGHTEIVGWRTWMKPDRQLEVVVPGGYSEYTEKGVPNRVDYPSGGQGSIIYPNGKRVYSFASFEDGKDLHQALLLQEGLRQLGTLPQIRRKLKNR